MSWIIRCRLWLALPAFLLSTAARTVEAQADQSAANAAGDARPASSDWPWWRDPNRNGVAAAGQTLPLQWSDSKNVVWRSPLPGRGHGSPVIVGDQVVVATADRQRNVQSVICVDRSSGRKLWETTVHRGGLSTKGNKKASLASSSLASDGERFFVNFLNDGAVYTTALDRQGRQLWQTRICDYVVHQGYGSSPAIYGALVIVSADNKGGGAIAALRRSNGQIAWRRSRPKKPNYASPVILRVAGRDQLLFTGCNLVSSFNPQTGEPLWEVEGATTECVTSTVTDGRHIFTSGGYPRNHVSAVRADGSGKVAWENFTRVYVPSMLAHRGYLYAVADAGFAICWNAQDGSLQWKARISGPFTASPVLADDKIFATSEKGTTYVFRASPQRFELLGENKLGDNVLASTSICGNRLYFRVAEGKPGRDRQEYLYCIGQP